MAALRKYAGRDPPIVPIAWVSFPVSRGTCIARLQSFQVHGKQNLLNTLCKEFDVSSTRGEVQELEHWVSCISGTHLSPYAIKRLSYNVYFRASCG